MREIKLKAYSKKYRHLNIIELKLYNGEISFVVCQDEKGKFIDFTEDEIKKGEIIFRQYTGMKDKNGKEIYEGDIVKLNSGVYKVKWDICPYLVKPEEENKLNTGIPLARIEVEDGEVIGNIYEIGE